MADYISTRSRCDFRIEMKPLPEGNHWLLDGRCEFWSGDQWRLFQVYTHPGPLFIPFIASNYIKDPEQDYHISICYREELWNWYKHLESERGWEYANGMLQRWVDTYRIVQTRYTGRHARLMGRLTRGSTLELDGHTQVDGVESPNHKLWDGPDGDPDMRFIHTLPGNNFPAGSRTHKSKQNFHVSLLLSRVDDPEPT